MSSLLHQWAAKWRDIARFTRAKRGAFALSDKLRATRKRVSVYPPLTIAATPKLVTPLATPLASVTPTPRLVTSLPAPRAIAADPPLVFASDQDSRDAQALRTYNLAFQGPGQALPNAVYAQSFVVHPGSTLADVDLRTAWLQRAIDVADREHIAALRKPTLRARLKAWARKIRTA